LIYFCFFPKGIASPNQSLTAAVEPGHGGTTRLAVQQLEEEAKLLLRAGIATATERTYTTNLKGFLSLCHEINLFPLPATEDTIILSM